MYPRLVGLSVCHSVCMSVTLMHPAKVVGQNEMPFRRDTSNIVSNEDRPISPYGEGDLGGQNPNRHDQSAAANSKHLY